MTREEFEQGYATRSKVSLGVLHTRGLYAFPCDCGEPVCKGWQMMGADSLSEEEIAAMPQEYQELANKLRTEE